MRHVRAPGRGMRMRVHSGAAATALVFALATGAPPAALGADQTPTPSAEELREAYPLDPSQDAGGQPAPPAGSGAETPAPTATPTPQRQEPRPATEPGDRAAAVGEDDGGAGPWLVVSLLALLAAAGAATLLVRRRASDGPRAQPAGVASEPEPKAPLLALFERSNRTAAPGAEGRAPAPASRRANGTSPAPAAAGTAATAGSSRTLSLVPADQPGPRALAAAASGSGPPPGPSASAPPAQSASSAPPAPEAESGSDASPVAASGPAPAPAPEAASGPAPAPAPGAGSDSAPAPAPEAGSGLPPAPVSGPSQAPAAASALGDPRNTAAESPASGEDAAPAGTPGPQPPDPESTWTAAVEWRATGGTSRFAVIATADDGGATEIASSEPVRWPPAGPDDVAALNAVVAALDATMLHAGWSALTPGDAWYAKRFAWDPQQASRPQPGAPSATHLTAADAPVPAPAASRRPGPPRQSLTAQPRSGEAAAARPTPAGEPAADAASGRFVRRKPWPEDSESLWRCEIKWDAGYKTSRFTATMRRPGARRGRIVAASAPFKWMLMAEPSDDAAAYRPAVLALVRGLEAAGWERVEPGAEWWAERFVWRRDDPPPEQVETDPVTTPSSDTPP